MKECFINNYNKEMILAWDANMDIQLALDPYAVITYIVNYMNKDETGLTKFMKEALFSVPTFEAKEKLRVLKTAYLTHRQVGASEAIYRINSGMKLKDSNIKCIFVQSGFPDNRTIFYKKVLEEQIEDQDKELKRLQAMETAVKKILNDDQIRMITTGKRVVYDHQTIQDAVMHYAQLGSTNYEYVREKMDLPIPETEFEAPAQF